MEPWFGADEGAQLLDDVQDLGAPLQRYQRKSAPFWTRLDFPGGSYREFPARCFWPQRRNATSVGPPREEVSLQTLEGTRSHAYCSVRQIELGTACGKLFRCSTMAILDAGDSDILNDQQA